MELASDALHLKRNMSRLSWQNIGRFTADFCKKVVGRASVLQHPLEGIADSVVPLAPCDAIEFFAAPA